MKQQLKVLSVVAAVALGTGSLLHAAAQSTTGQSSAGDNSQACSPAQVEANKKLALTIGPNSDDLLDPSYIQHNPQYFRFGELNGVNGRDAVMLFEQRGLDRRSMEGKMQLQPGQPPHNFFYKVIAECDMVVLVSQHWHPYPDNPQAFYATYFFNMWRIKEGKLMEHWDPVDMPMPMPDYLKYPLKDLNPDGTRAATATKPAKN